METQTKTIINISPEQSKVLAEKGEFIYLEPMDPQRPDKSFWDVFLNHKSGHEVMANLIICPFQVGQEISVKPPIKVDSSKGLFWQTVKVKETLVPKRIQNISLEDWNKIITWADWKGITPAKDWFNKQWGEPRPILKCNYKRPGETNHLCLKCKKEIESYICYVYDNGSEWGKDFFAKGEIKYKDKSLKIIINPWNNLVRIGIDK